MDVEPGRKRAIIADDHAIVRSALSDILSGLGVDVVAEATNGVETVSMCRAHEPDLLTIDAGMPLMTGLDAFCDVRRWSPATRVCLVTGFTSTGALSGWLAAGVHGVVLKSADTDEIAETFGKVLAGDVHIAPSAADRLDAGRARTPLTSREMQVLCLVANGFSNADIAEQMSVSPKTVENHRSRMMRKLGVHGIGQLVTYALREGLLDPSAQL